MAAGTELERRLDLVADRLAMRATGMKAATGRRVDGAWNVALKNGALFLTAGVGERDR